MSDYCTKMNLSSKQIGYLFVLCGVSLYAFSDAVMQYFMQIYGVNRITFLRTVFRFIPVLFCLYYNGENPLKTKKLKENVLRAMLASLGTYSFMLAYKHTSMTDTTVIGYTSALFIIPMNIIFLREKLYIKDVAAVLIGFAGIVLAFRPGLGIFQFGIMYAIFGAIVGALNQVLIKKLSYTDGEFTIIFYHHIVLLLFSLIIGMDSLFAILPAHLLVIFIGGIIGTIAQYCMIHAYKLSTASNLASAAYIMLLPVTLIDLLMYHIVPDVFILGGLILIVSGSCIAMKKW